MATIAIAIIIKAIMAELKTTAKILMRAKTKAEAEKFTGAC